MMNEIFESIIVWFSTKIKYVLPNKSKLHLNPFHLHLSQEWQVDERERDKRFHDLNKYIHDM